jgi:hypothetical protein
MPPRVRTGAFDALPLVLRDRGRVGVRRRQDGASLAIAWARPAAAVKYAVIRVRHRLRVGVVVETTAHRSSASRRIDGEPESRAGERIPLDSIAGTDGFGSAFSATVIPCSGIPPERGVVVFRPGIPGGIKPARSLRSSSRQLGALSDAPGRTPRDSSLEPRDVVAAGDAILLGGAFMPTPRRLASLWHEG